MSRDIHNDREVAVDANDDIRKYDIKDLFLTKVLILILNIRNKKISRSDQIRFI